MILTTFEDDEYIFGALTAGASGFLLKRASPEELLAAIKAVAAGDSLLSPSVTAGCSTGWLRSRRARRSSTTAPRADAGSARCSSSSRAGSRTSRSPRRS